MLCEPGGAVDFFESGAPWRDGKTPVNVSGGLESKGHPIAATGIANIWEVCHHLRGEAGDRQIEGAKVGLAHVIGLGSACGVHILERPPPDPPTPVAAWTFSMRRTGAKTIGGRFVGAGGRVVAGAGAERFDQAVGLRLLLPREPGQPEPQEVRDRVAHEQRSADDRRG